ncbi:MAG: hypothetical protein LQ347_001649 [Umbilicaria vellea]|nr:MAG: hypothetical protein LQ347_001649 [Umbilicaria vellea]
MGPLGWVRNILSEAADESILSEDLSNTAEPEQSGGPESRDDPNQSEKAKGSQSPKARKDSEAPVNTTTSSSYQKLGSSSSNSGSSNWTTSSSGSKKRNPSAFEGKGRGKEIKREPPKSHGSLSSDPSSDFPMRVPGDAKGKNPETGSLKSHGSSSSSASSDFPTRRPGTSKGKKPEKRSRKSQGSSVSDVSSEFGFRRPGVSIATEIPASRRQADSPVPPAKWPPARSETRRRPSWPRPTTRGLKIFDGDPELDSPRTPGGDRPPPFGPDDFWNFHPAHHRSSPPGTSESRQLFLDDPNELYNASPRQSHTTARQPTVPNPDWVLNEAVLHRPLDDPAFDHNQDGSDSQHPLSESSIKHVRRQLRVRNNFFDDRRGSLEEQQQQQHNTEYVEHFKINPLEGLKNPAGAGPEVGMGLQGFMAEMQGQGEIKGYHADQIGDVSRDDFNEFKAITNASISELRRVAFNAAKKQWDAKREVKRQNMLTQAAEERAKAAEERAQAAEERAKAAEEKAASAASGRRDPYAPVSASIHRTRAPGSPVYTAQETREGDLISDNGKDDRTFLYTNSSDQTRELTVRVTLLRARTAGQHRDWNHMENMARSATRVAEQLDYAPLVGRCFFYRGIAEFMQQRWTDAQASFDEARACKGKYKEGPRVESWCDMAARGQEAWDELSENTAESESESSRSPTDRRGSYAEPEHPPEFDPDDFKSDEEGEEAYETGADPTVQQNEGAGPAGPGGVHEMGLDTVVPPERRQSVQEEVHRRLSRDDSPKGSKSTD